jgi:HK97 family phage major capsid protein
MDETTKRALRAYLAEMSKGEKERDAKAMADAEKVLQASLDSSTPEKATAMLDEIRKEVAQLRKDLDAESESRRQAERRSLIFRAPSGQPLVDGRGRLRMRFSHPELSREMYGLAKAIHTARTGGTVDKVLVPSGPQGEGYVIPETLSTEIERMVETVGVMRGLAGPIPLGAGTNKFARRLAGAIAYFKTAGAEATESEPEFGQYEMSAETLIALIETALEFEEDSAVNIGDFIATEMAYAIALKEDDAAINGDGSAGYGGITGILNSTYVTVKTMEAADDAFTDLDTMDYLTDMESEVWDGALANATFLLHRSIKALVKKIKDSAGLPIWQPAVGGEPSEILGYPHAVSGKMPALAATAASTKFLAFGDFRRGLKTGRRGTYRLDWSPIPGFKNLTNCWRAFERIDMAVVGFTAAEIAAHTELGNPICVLRTGAGA